MEFFRRFTENVRKVGVGQQQEIFYFVISQNSHIAGQADLVQRQFSAMNLAMERQVRPISYFQEMAMLRRTDMHKVHMHQNTELVLRPT